MNKRKVSCLECRLKKTKCDGQTPCGRCASKGITDCVYSKLRAPGRPFKNATITKLSLSSIDKASFCKEFILENVNEIKKNQSKQKQMQIQQKGKEEEEEEHSLAGIINHSFKTVFKHYESSLAVNHQLKKEIDSIPERVYISSLNHLFMSTACHISGVIIRRLSNLRLSYYSQTSFLTYALNKDRSFRFFSTPSPNALVSNPLLSLPPNEAIHLIDAFFELDPYSILLNKTIILQKYWSDTADPLIMSVIYGSALAKLPLKQNQPLELWDSWEKGNNPFLEYAYILLFSKDTEMTPDVYIATCLLALFEGCFGYSKRALALFSVIIVMGARLRLSDKAYLASIDPLKRESLIMSFWMTYKASVCGCLELESAAAYLYAKIKVPLPPINAQYSASYHYDLLNNNIASPQERSYLVESFYLECIIAKINQKILVYASTKQKTPEYSKGEEILKILDEVKHDISNERSSWSKLQEFTIDCLLLYYTICFSFLREDSYNFFLQWSEIPSKLDLTKPDAVYLVNRNLPYATQLVDKIMDFLGRPELCYNDYSYAPMSLIGSQLDSASQILMYSAILDPHNSTLRDYLELIVMMLDNAQHWAKWDMTAAIKEPISKFLKEFYYSSPSSSQETITPSTFDFNWLQDDFLWDPSIVPFYSYTDNIDIHSLFDGII